MPRGDLKVECLEREVGREDGSGHDPGKLAQALSALVG
jgi:hypothetical protein